MSDTATGTSDTATATVVTARIIMTGRADTIEFIYADTATAVRALRAEFRGTGVSMRADGVTQLTDGGTRQNWNLYRGSDHVGYADVSESPAPERPHFLVMSGETVIAGAYTDGETDADDIAIAVADIAAKWHIANGAPRLHWTAPSKLTDRQASVPENGDEWNAVRSAAYELISAGRNFTETVAGRTYVNHIPPCAHCEDRAIVTAWQNYADAEWHSAHELEIGETATIRQWAREFVGAPGDRTDDWRALGRCWRCAGRNGNRDETPDYAYGRVDDAYRRRAPGFVKLAAERVALDVDPDYRAGDAAPLPFTLCVRSLAGGDPEYHTLYGFGGALEMARTSLGRIAAELTATTGRAYVIEAQPDPGHLYVPGLHVLDAETREPVASADFAYRVVTNAMVTGNARGANLGTINRGLFSGRTFRDLNGTRREFVES